MSMLSFFSATLAGPRFVENEKFCYYGNGTFWLLFSIKKISHSYSSLFQNRKVSLLLHPTLVQCKVTAVVCQCYPFFTQMKRSQVSLLLRKDCHRVAKTVQTVTKNYLFLGFISTKAYQKSTSSSKESSSHESPMYAVDCEMVGRLLKHCNIYHFCRVTFQVTRRSSHPKSRGPNRRVKLSWICTFPSFLRAQPRKLYPRK